MKRLLSTALILLALGVAAFFFFKLRRLLPERPRGAELAPAETIFFAQCPNLRQTALRVPRTDLYQIWSEPEMQAFLEKPRQRAPWMRQWVQWFEQAERVAPGEAFVAVTSVAGTRPSFVAGFSMAGRKSQATPLADELCEKLLPGGKKSETRLSKDDVMETLTSPDGEVVTCFHANWFLAASSEKLLRGALDRFDGKPDGSLSTDPLFQKSIAVLGAGQDLVIYGKPASLAGRLDALTEVVGAENASEAIVMGTKIDGGRLRDTIFVPGAGPSSQAALSHQTATLAPPQALFYYATDIGMLPTAVDSPWVKSLVFPNMADLEQALAAKGLSWPDLRAALGPEVALIFDWPEEAALPTVLVACEIRDRAKVSEFAATIANPDAGWISEKREGGTEVFMAPTKGLSILRPAFALTDRFALLGLNPEAVAGAVPKPDRPALRRNATFEEVLRLVPPDAAALGYLDFQRAFERSYRAARPIVVLSLAFSAEAGEQFDAGKLPPVEAISKHLGPTVFTQTKTAEGTVMGSVGSVTLSEVFVAMGLAGLSGSVPGVESILPAGAKKWLPSTSPVRSVKPREPEPATPAPVER